MVAMGKFINAPEASIQQCRGIESQESEVVCKAEKEITA